MHPQPNLAIVHGAAPCAGVPTITTVGTPTPSDNGACPDGSPIIDTALTLSGSLPTGAKVQYRARAAYSSGSPSGGWTDWPGGFSGSGPNTLVDDLSPLIGEIIGSGGSTLYYDIEFQVVGTDGTTVCDGPDPGSNSWAADQCFA